MNTKLLMDDYCFACGNKNDNGLRLNILESPNGVKAAIRLPGWAQGYHKIVHGGIISTILDEVAVWAAYKSGYKSRTAELNVRIKKAMPIDDKYIAQGMVVAVKHRLILAKSEIIDENNEVIALADVKLMRSE